MPAGGNALGLADRLLAKVDAMEAELSKLREQADARRYHLEQVEQELRLASRLQRDFLPKRLPHGPRIRFNRLYRPAGHVSGDLYDVRRLDERHAGVYLADAIGHGMPAALLAMFMHNALHTKRIDPDNAHGYRLLTAAEAIKHLNETLCGQDLAHATFATAVYATVTLDTGEVEFCRAGHPLAMLLRHDGTLTEVGGDGALLGVMPHEVFEPCRITLDPGDRLIFFTDGVETAFVEPGALPDFDAWRQAVRDVADHPADKLVAALWNRLEGVTPSDDVTIVTLEGV
jgi:sigma-B regulation protein RsbU (phosphoserine phosphatase)